MELFIYFSYPSKKNICLLEQKFFIFSRTCLSLVIRFRQFPYKAIIDKGGWYRGKGEKNNNDNRIAK